MGGPQLVGSKLKTRRQLSGGGVFDLREVWTWYGVIFFDAARFFVCQPLSTVGTYRQLLTQ